MNVQSGLHILCVLTQWWSICLLFKQNKHTQKNCCSKKKKKKALPAMCLNAEKKISGYLCLALPTTQTSEIATGKINNKLSEMPTKSNGVPHWNDCLGVRILTKNMSIGVRWALNVLHIYIQNYCDVLHQNTRACTASVLLSHHLSAVSLLAVSFRIQKQAAC